MMKVISNPSDLNVPGTTKVLIGELLDRFDSRKVIGLNECNHPIVTTTRPLKISRTDRCMDSEAPIFWDGVGTIKIDSSFANSNLQSRR
jgi:hypothetical protein